MKEVDASKLPKIGFIPKDQNQLDKLTTHLVVQLGLVDLINEDYTRDRRNLHVSYPRDEFKYKEGKVLYASEDGVHYRERSLVTTLTDIWEGDDRPFRLIVDSVDKLDKPIKSKTVKMELF